MDQIAELNKFGAIIYPPSSRLEVSGTKSVTPAIG